MLHTHLCALHWPFCGAILGILLIVASVILVVPICCFGILNIIIRNIIIGILITIIVTIIISIIISINIIITISIPIRIHVYG